MEISLLDQVLEIILGLHGVSKVGYVLNVVEYYHQILLHVLVVNLQ